MVKPAKKIIHSAVIDAIKKHNKVSYAEIAQSIQVHPTFIQKVSKGERILSEEKLSQLCERWDIQIEVLLKRLDLEQIADLRRRTLIKILNVLKIELRSLPDQTGISVLDLVQIELGKRDATDDELERIAAAIGLDGLILKDGLIAVMLEVFQKTMECAYFHPSSKEAIMRFVEMEMLDKKIPSER